jgi:hypothetical protein
MVANQRAFDAPGTYLRAAGQASFGGPNTAIYAADGTIAAYVANGGIESPQPHTINTGTRLIRFGQNGVAELVVQGEWWMEDVEFRKVETFAREKKMGIGAAVRMLCAVPSEWSGLDLAVVAVTVGPLLAYRGFGNPAVIPASQGRKATDGYNNSGLVDAFGKPAGAVFGARPAKLAQAPAFARAEYIGTVPDTKGQRIAQLFIPGLGNGDVRRDTILFLGTRFLPREQAMLGYAPQMV